MSLGPTSIIVLLVESRRGECDYSSFFRVYGKKEFFRFVKLLREKNFSFSETSIYTKEFNYAYYIPSSKTKDRFSTTLIRNSISLPKFHPFEAILRSNSPLSKIQVSCPLFSLPPPNYKSWTLKLGCLRSHTKIPTALC